MQELKKILKKLNIPLDVKGTNMLEDIKKNKIHFLESMKFKKFIKPNIGAYVLVNKELYNAIKEISGNKYVIVDRPAQVFFKLHNLFFKDAPQFTIPLNNKSVIGKNTEISSEAKIYPNVIIGSNVKIGKKTVIYPNVSIYDNVEIGENCIIESGTVLGTEGFRMLKDEKGNNIDVKHTGKIIIGNHVKIGSCSAINRGLFIDTTIGDYVKIAGFCEIGHNCLIGKNTVICSSVNVNGSVTIGKNCWISSGCSIADHVKIGEGCRLQLNSVVASSIPSKTTVAGFYAMNDVAWRNKTKDDFKKYVIKMNEKNEK